MVWPGVFVLSLMYLRLCIKNHRTDFWKCCQSVVKILLLLNKSSNFLEQSLNKIYSKRVHRVFSKCDTRHSGMRGFQSFIHCAKSQLGPCVAKSSKELAFNISVILPLSMWV
ncbi:hypothetical protein CHS0354_027489 [Potamilus streckersoni]|uniref:Secreted protein n=1 Tax=Potamilus streckersoni TaxID=2493646 RepID=A0AAE0S4F5_9BIVA|nr:hypothetical protein CHS0354_027489 [Potamilus streckersoni]